MRLTSLLGFHTAQSLPIQPLSIHPKCVFYSSQIPTPYNFVDRWIRIFKLFKICLMSFSHLYPDLQPLTPGALIHQTKPTLWDYCFVYKRWIDYTEIIGTNTHFSRWHVEPGCTIKKTQISIAGVVKFANTHNSKSAPKQLLVKLCTPHFWSLILKAGVGKVW